MLAGGIPEGVITPEGDLGSEYTQVSMFMEEQLFASSVG
jgi:hypothetical protein